MIPRVSLPYEPASRRKHVENPQYLIGSSFSWRVSWAWSIVRGTSEVPTKYKSSSPGLTLYISFISAGKNPVAYIAFSFTRTGGITGVNPLLLSFCIVNWISANSSNAASPLR